MTALRPLLLTPAAASPLGAQVLWMAPPEEGVDLYGILTLGRDPIQDFDGDGVPDPFVSARHTVDGELVLFSRLLSGAKGGPAGRSRTGAGGPDARRERRRRAGRVGSAPLP